MKNAPRNGKIEIVHNFRARPMPIVFNRTPLFFDAVVVASLVLTLVCDKTKRVNFGFEFTGRKWEMGVCVCVCVRASPTQHVKVNNLRQKAYQLDLLRP